MLRANAQLMFTTSTLHRISLTADQYDRFENFLHELLSLEKAFEMSHLPESHAN